MTTSLFAVLPLLTEQAKALMKGYARVGGRRHRRHLPASFNFPPPQAPVAELRAVCRLVCGHRVPVTAYPQLATTGLLVMFGNVNAAMPFLAGHAPIPADTFRP
jgi:hypothetical protein